MAYSSTDNAAQKYLDRRTFRIVICRISSYFLRTACVFVYIDIIQSIEIVNYDGLIHFDNGLCPASHSHRLAELTFVVLFKFST